MKIRLLRDKRQKLNPTTARILRANRVWTPQTDADVEFALALIHEGAAVYVDPGHARQASPVQQGGAFDQRQQEILSRMADNADAQNVAQAAAQAQALAAQTDTADTGGNDGAGDIPLDENGKPDFGEFSDDEIREFAQVYDITPGKKRRERLIDEIVAAMSAAEAA